MAIANDLQCSQPFGFTTREDAVWREEIDEWIDNVKRLREMKEFSDTQWVIFPDDVFVFYWQFVIVFLLLYTATVTIFRITFIDDESTTWLVIDHIVDGLFFIDIIVNCFSAYYDSEMNLVTAHRRIVVNYLRTWMLPDLAACFPFAEVLGNTKNYHNAIRIMRLPRLYKLIKVTKMLRVLKVAKDRTVIHRNMQSLFKFSQSMEKLILMLTFFLLVIHMIACLWAFVAKLDSTDDNWIFQKGFADSDTTELYIVSIYWVVTTLATVGYGDILPYNNEERIVCSLVMLIGVISYSYIISSISGLIGNLDRSKVELSRKLGLLNEIARQFKLSKIFYKKLSKAIEYDNSRKLSTELIKMIDDLPKKIKSALLYIIHKKMIESNAFFEGKPISFISSIAEVLKPYLTDPKEIIYKEDEVAVEMYLIYKGDVSFVITQRMVPYLVVGENYYFGEVDLLVSAKGRHSATAVSNSVCELFAIEKTALLALLDKFPSIKDELLVLANDRLRRNYELKAQAFNELHSIANLTRRQSTPISPTSRSSLLQTFSEKAIEEVAEDSKESVGSDFDWEEESDNLKTIGSKSRSDSKKSSGSLKSNISFYDVVQKLSSTQHATKLSKYLKFKRKVVQLQRLLSEVADSQVLAFKQLDMLEEKPEDRVE